MSAPSCSVSGCPRPGTEVVAFDRGGYRSAEWRYCRHHVWPHREHVVRSEAVAQ